MSTQIADMDELLDMTDVMAEDKKVDDASDAGKAAPDTQGEPSRDDKPADDPEASGVDRGDRPVLPPARPGTGLTVEGAGLSEPVHIPPVAVGPPPLQVLGGPVEDYDESACQDFDPYEGYEDGDDELGDAPLPAAAPPASPPGPPQIQGPTEEPDVAAVQAQQRMVEQAVAHARAELGIDVLSDPAAADTNNQLHQIIALMRWNPAQLGQVGPHRLNEFEAVLSAHQVYVQAMENDWKAKHGLYGHLLAGIKQSRIGSVEARTVKEKEHLIVTGDPDVKRLHDQFLLAQAMAAVLDGMGERFSQLENGLKRTINLVEFDYTHSAHQRQAP